MQGARRGFINGKQDMKAAEKHCGVHRFVNFGLLFWVVWDAVANGPLTMYCLTGLLFISLHVSEVLFSGVVSAHT